MSLGQRRLQLAALTAASALLVSLSLMFVAHEAEAAGATPAVAPSAAGTFVPLAPARIFDTRPSHWMGSWQPAEFQVPGRGGVPASGVSAVALNVTATGATSGGSLLVLPKGYSANVSTLQLKLRDSVANQVIVPVGDGGVIRLFNASGGRLDVIVDVSGYFLSGTPSVAGALHALQPERVLDTRSGTGVLPGAVPAGGSLVLQVAGRGGVAASGAAAAVLNVTVVSPRGTGVLAVWGHGDPQPVASNLNFVHGPTVSNLVVTPIGSDGRVVFQNRSAGPLNLVADLSGYFLAGAPTEAGAYAPLTPARILDTRNPSGFGVPGGGEIVLQVTGRGGVPATGVSAVEINVTAVSNTASGVISVWPDGKPAPRTSSLNYVAGQPVPNLVLAPVGADGKIRLQNRSGGSVQLVGDVEGYFLG